MTGRQLARVSAVKYGETVWSGLYPGNRQTVQCLQPAVLGTEFALELAPEQCQRVVWRLDGGAGSDDKLRWLLARGYQVIAKGFSNARAQKLARQVQRWDPYGDGWVGEVVPPVAYGRPVRVFVKRTYQRERWQHAYFISTLKLPAKGRYLACYDARGGAEVEQFRQDKQALFLAAKRKHRFQAQKGFLLLADLTHNLLAHFRRHALADSRFAAYGLQRLVRDLLATPGRLTFAGSQLTRVDLLTQKQNAEALKNCLQRYLLHG